MAVSPPSLHQRPSRIQYAVAISIVMDCHAILLCTSWWLRTWVWTYLYNLEFNVAPDPPRSPLQPFIHFIPMAEQQAEFIRNLTKAYVQRSIPTLSNLLHPDYDHVTRPQSVNIPNQNKAQYLEYVGKMFDNWTDVETVSCFFGSLVDFLSPPLNPSCSRPSQLSQIPRGKSLFTFVSQTFETTPRPAIY